MANKRPASKPMNAKAFMASLNSPWRSVGRDISKITSIHIPSPTIDLPEVNYDMLINRLSKPAERTQHRSTTDMWRQMYDYNDQNMTKEAIKNLRTVVGLLTSDTVNNRQRQRMTPDVLAKLNEIFVDQDNLRRAGIDPVQQNEGLTNRIFDILSRFEYAGATNEARNAKDSVGMTEALAVGSQVGFGLINQWLTGNRTEAQRLWDEATGTRAELEDNLREVAERAGTDSTEYASLEQVYKNFLTDRAIRLGTYNSPSGHPTTRSDPSEPISFGKRPKGEYKTEFEKKESASRDLLLQRMKEYEAGELKLNIVPDIIPVNAKEAKDWWAGFSGKSKKTYIGNLQKKGIDPGASIFAGLVGSIAFDPLTYITGGGGAVAKGAKFAELGKLERSLIAVKDLDGAKDIIKRLEPILNGEKISLGGKSFTFGKNSTLDFEEILTGGARTGRQSKASIIAKQQRRILDDFSFQLDEVIKKRYGSLHEDMMEVKKAMLKASDPAVIDAKVKNIASRAASLNLNKDVADALEGLIKKGDLLDVPQPKPKAAVGTLDELPEQSFDEVMATRTRRSNYLSNQAQKFVRATAKPLKKTKGAVPRNIRTASTVVSFTSMSRVPLSRIIEETLALARDNIPGMSRALENYDEYIKTYGNDPTKVLLVEDVAATPGLIKKSLVAPEVRRILPLFDVSDIKNISKDPLGRMFKSMGYTDEETVYILQRYKAAMAQRLNVTFAQGKNTLRLSDHVLDWSDVAAARKANAKAMVDVVSQVGKQGEMLRQDISEFMAKAAIDFGQRTGTKSALEVRFAGIPFVHFTTPNSVNKAFNKFMQADSVIASSMRHAGDYLITNFRGYSAFDAELNHARTQFVGSGEQVINAHLNYLHRLWTGVPRSDQIKIMDNWAAGATPETLEKFGPQLASLDETYLALQSYMPGMFRKSIDEISVDELADHFNKWLPNSLRLNKDVLKQIKADGRVEYMSPDMWKAYFRRLTLNRKQGGRKTGNLSALDMTWQMRMAMEKEIARANLLDNIETTWGTNIKGIDKNDPALKVLRSGPPGERWDNIQEFGKDVIFPPDIARDIRRMLDMVDYRHSSEIAYGAIARMTTFWKAMVTVYNVPDYFIRNALSDTWMMFFSGFNPRYAMAGPKILADTSRYVKLLRENPDFVRAFAAADPLNRESMEQAVSLADHVAKGNESATALSFKHTLRGPNGEQIDSLTSAQILKYYFEYGLETNFVRTSLAAVRQISPRASKYVGEPIKVANSYGEDARRLSLFVDGMAKAEARGIRNIDEVLEYGAEHTRKYLFDYSDFSNFERNILGRLIPFYKWTRKAVPLMTEMLFLKPGKIAIIPKINTAMGEAMGMTNEGNESLPWLASNDAIVPSWMRLNPYIYMGDNGQALGPEGQYGTYAAFPNPFTDVMSRTVDPLLPGDETIDPTASLGERALKYAQGAGYSVLAQGNPFLRGILETQFGEQAFGANELGGRPIEGPGGVAQYGLGLFPQIRKAQEGIDTLQGDAETGEGLLQFLNLIGALNLQKNDPNKQMSELMFLKQISGTAAERANKKYLGSN